MPNGIVICDVCGGKTREIWCRGCGKLHSNDAKVIVSAPFDEKDIEEYVQEIRGKKYNAFKIHNCIFIPYDGRNLTILVEGEEISKKYHYYEIHKKLKMDVGGSQIAP